MMATLAFNELKSAERQQYMINSNIKIENPKKSCNRIENPTKERDNYKEIKRYLNGKELCRPVF